LTITASLSSALGHDLNTLEYSPSGGNSRSGRRPNIELQRLGFPLMSSYATAVGVHDPLLRKVARVIKRVATVEIERLRGVQGGLADLLINVIRQRFPPQDGAEVLLDVGQQLRALGFEKLGEGIAIGEPGVAGVGHDRICPAPCTMYL
jgi:hypothetical protein